jgi:hypothetical protein
MKQPPPPPELPPEEPPDEPPLEPPELVELPALQVPPELEPLDVLLLEEEPQ